jgi:hypothetical protein
MIENQFTIPPSVAAEARSWPFEEARRLIQRLDRME